MPIVRYSLVLASALLVSLFVYDACFGHGNDPTSPAGAIALRWPENDAFRLTVNADQAAQVAKTPAARVRETFAMFLPGDYRRMHDTARPPVAAVGRQG